ncbi:MAG: hypothetical protein ACT4P1_03095 [Sporichthyaceae bacterium]
MSLAVDALLRAYPQRFDASSAGTWVATRRALLTERATPATTLSSSVSSGCALNGATEHVRRLGEEAAHALARLDAGLGTACEACQVSLDFDRLDSAPAAVRCTPCARAVAAPVDTTYCR